MSSTVTADSRHSTDFTESKGATGPNGFLSSTYGSFGSTFAPYPIPSYPNFTTIAMGEKIVPPAGVTMSPLGVITVANNGIYLVSWNLGVEATAQANAFYPEFVSSLSGPFPHVSQNSVGLNDTVVLSTTNTYYLSSSDTYRMQITASTTGGYITMGTLSIVQIAP
jgi:hypothetical protein